MFKYILDDFDLSEYNYSVYRIVSPGMNYNTEQCFASGRPSFKADWLQIYGITYPVVVDDDDEPCPRYVIVGSVGTLDLL